MFFDFIIFPLLPLLIVYFLYARWSDDAPLKIFGIPLNKAAIKEFAGVDEDAGFIEGLKQAFSPEIMFGPNSLLTSKNRRKKYYETLVEKEIAFEKNLKCPNCGYKEVKTKEIELYLSSSDKLLDFWKISHYWTEPFVMVPGFQCSICHVECVVVHQEIEISNMQNIAELQNWNERYSLYNDYQLTHNYKGLKFAPFPYPREKTWKHF